MIVTLLCLHVWPILALIFLDDSVADPNFINSKFLTNSQELGASGFNKNNVECEEQNNKLMALLFPVKIKSE